MYLFESLKRRTKNCLPTYPLLQWWVEKQQTKYIFKLGLTDLNLDSMYYVSDRYCHHFPSVVDFTSVSISLDPMTKMVKTFLNTILSATVLMQSMHKVVN